MFAGRTVQLVPLSSANRGLSPRTVGHVHRVIRRALGHAQLWGLVRHNVAAQAQPPRVEDTEIEVLSLRNGERCSRAFELKRPCGQIMWFGSYRFHSWQRQSLAPVFAAGSFAPFAWKDVDLDHGKLRVEQSLEQTKAGLRFKAPKTKRGRRTITLAPTLVTEFRSHWKVQQEQRLALGDRQGASGRTSVHSLG